MLDKEHLMLRYRTINAGSVWSQRNNGRNEGAGDLSLDRRIETSQNRRQDTYNRYEEDVLENKDDQTMYKGRKNLKVKDNIKYTIIYSEEGALTSRREVRKPRGVLNFLRVHKFNIWRHPWDAQSHPLVLSKEPMADPAQTPVATNTSVAKPRRDETPVSAHPYLCGMTNIDAPIITDYSDEEEAGGFRITPEFVHSHMVALKAQLVEIEKVEKLKDVHTRLTFVENNPTIQAKEVAPVDQLLTTLLEAIRHRKEPAGKEHVDPAQVENDETLNPLLQPYHPTNFTDMSKFTKQIAEKLKVPLNIQGVPEVMKISSFINGVRQPQLCENLGEDFPTTFDDLMDKVRAFLRDKDTSLRAREWDLKKGAGPYRTREGNEG
ncbi:hypothetical protein E3N88_27302 [Mikania micrantha]|uniref:Uncharacterized protein n=1 Tax=Mikania micrantha TaxID=192012 RepID=A0A5N6MWY6_9ASTR|nr:hypothetical protein E3N88_27302 [Mikania micrantha]